MMKITRTIIADTPAQLAVICKNAGYIRADIWRRYGALGNVGVSASAVRTEIVASEDLTTVIASKHQWKRFNRRMSAWAKGILAEALDSVCEQRNAKHTLVNGAYTSQTDSTNGLLEGKREGDKFYRANGDVLQADHNAALNVLARLDDCEITRFTPYKEVKRILLSRSPAQLSVKGLELGAQARQPSADKSYAQICATF